MKNKFTYFYKGLSFVLFLMFYSNAYSQAPANDLCGNAEALVLAADPASCVAVVGDTRMTASAIGVAAPDVCSGSWYEDDVWYSVTIADIPTYGIKIEATFDNATTATDVLAVGMAFYEGNTCSANNNSLVCFSDGTGDVRTMRISPGCLTANSTYLIRVWSGGSPTTNSGTFNICAYENPAPSNPPGVYWQEDFEDGIGDWTGLPMNDPEENWVWAQDGTFIDLFGGTNSMAIPEDPACSATMNFPSGWYQTGMTGDPAQIGDYTDYQADLISPVIDLSAVTGNLALEFSQYISRLNQNSVAIPFSSVSVSIDGGATWGPYIAVNSDFEERSASNPTAPRNSIERVELLNVGGESNVRIKFTWSCDFYFWSIDDIKIVDGTDYNVTALSNRYAAAPNAVTPRKQLVPHHFLLDVRNNGQEDLTDINLNITIEDINGGAEFSADKLLTDIITPLSEQSDNVWDESWTPDTLQELFVGTYSITIDSTDENESDNARSYAFAVSDSVYAKDLTDYFSNFTLDAQVGGFFVPSDNSTTVGNCFYVPKGEGYEVTSVAIQFSNADEHAGLVADVFLLKWVDDNGDQLPTGDELGFANSVAGDILGFAQYEILGTETGDIQLTLPGFPDEEDPLLLEDDAYYILAVSTEVTDVNADPVGIAATSNYDYLNAFFVSDSVGVLDPDVRTMYHAFYSGDAGFGTAGEGMDFTSYVWSESPRLVMNVNRVQSVSTKDPILSDDNVFNVYPNPTDKLINLEVDLVEKTEKALVKIYDTSGKIIMEQDYSDIQEANLSYSVEHYVDGIYFVEIVTDQGVKTKRFSVVH